MRARVCAVLLAALAAACGGGGDDGGGDGGRAGSGGAIAGAGGGAAGSSSGQNAGGSGNAGSGNPGGTSSQAGSAGTGGGGNQAGGTGNQAGNAGSAANGVRGAISLNILKPDGCSLDAQYQDFPKVATGHPVTETEKGPGVLSGEMVDGYAARVTCSWLAGAAASMVISLGPMGQARALNLGTKLVEGQAATNAVVFDDPALDLPGSYHGPCMVTPTEVDQTTHSVRGTFTCAEFGPTDASDHCAIGPSYFFFENCTVK